MVSLSGHYLFVLAGLLILWRAVIFLRSAVKQRKARIQEKTQWSAVKTRGPLNLKGPLALQAQAIERVEHQFSVTKRVMIPGAVVFLALVLSLPYMASAPAQIASVILGVVTVLLGIAAKPLLENAVAGLVISYSKLVNLGDTVRIKGQYGTVEDISSTHTTIKLWDWRRFLVPNAELLKLEILNYSLNGNSVWAHAELWVAHDTDLELVQRLAQTCALESPYLSKGAGPPEFWIMRAERDAVCCWVAAWADTPANAWMLQHELQRDLYTAFKKNGIKPSQRYWAQSTVREGPALEVA